MSVGRWWLRLNGLRSSPEERLRAALGEARRVDRVGKAANLVKPPDPALTVLCHLLRRQIDAPMAFVSFVDDRVQTLRAGVGLPASVPVGSPMPLQHSMCASVVASRRPVVAGDTSRVRMFDYCEVVADLPAYAAAPIRLHDCVVGALAVADTRTRPDWSDPEAGRRVRSTLEVYGREIDLHMADRDAGREPVPARVLIEALRPDELSVPADS